MAAPAWPPEFIQTPQLGGACFQPGLGPFLLSPSLHQLPGRLLWDRERERGRIESCLDLLLPQSHSHWQTSGPHPHWGPSVVVDAPRDEVSLAPDTRLMAGALRERVKWFALSSTLPTQPFSHGNTRVFQWNVQCFTQSFPFTKVPKYPQIHV